jgi:hypothetical protein
MDTITLKELQDAKRLLEKEIAYTIAQFQEIFNVQVNHVDWHQRRLYKCGMPTPTYVEQSVTLDVKL